MIQTKPNPIAKGLSADDWGMSPSVNQGILQLARRGVLKKVSLLINAAFASNGLDELRDIPGLTICLHVSFTFEGLFPSPRALMSALHAPSARRRAETRRVLRGEFLRQSERFSALGLGMNEFDSHHHVHLFPGMASILAQAGERAGFQAVRILRRHERFSRPFRDRALEAFSKHSESTYAAAGLRLAPALLVDSSRLREAAQLRALLLQDAGTAVLIHPATEDDFDRVGCKDAYREPRVHEFQLALRL